MKDILPYLSNSSAICSPFLGGGSIELAAAEKGIRVYGYDGYAPLVHFWEHLLCSPSELAERVAGYHPLSKEQFYRLQAEVPSEPLDCAAAFYVLNRASFSGSTLSGGMSPGHPRFTPKSIEVLRSFVEPNLSVMQADFRDSITQHPDAFLYCDPPYAVESRLYGDRGSMHAGFDHIALANLLRGRRGWALSYNDCALVRELYDDYDFVLLDWKYGMGKDKTSNEVLILA